MIRDAVNDDFIEPGGLERSKGIASLYGRSARRMDRKQIISDQGLDVIPTLLSKRICERILIELYAGKLKIPCMMPTAKQIAELAAQAVASTAAIRVDRTKDQACLGDRPASRLLTAPYLVQTPADKCGSCPGANYNSVRKFATASRSRGAPAPKHS